MKVLLIEDSKIAAPALIGALKLKGVECVWAKDGARGLDMAKREKPVLILLDLMLPRISGFDVCKKLKTEDATWRIPVVVMSTLTDDESKERAKEAGADYFIEKPYSLAATVDQILKFLPKAD
ncbi:MAG: response regulator [Elusimicrobia bacterium]|nr:response regulator [Elusimicrobiota bacterium]